MTFFNVNELISCPSYDTSVARIAPLGTARWLYYPEHQELCGGESAICRAAISLKSHA